MFFEADSQGLNASFDLKWVAAGVAHSPENSRQSGGLDALDGPDERRLSSPLQLGAVLRDGGDRGDE